MESLRRSWQKIPRPARKILISVIGGLVVVAGICMLVLPGPGWAAIFLGLAILATEFEGADRLKNKLIERFKSAFEAVRKNKKH